MTSQHKIEQPAHAVWSNLAKHFILLLTIFILAWLGALIAEALV